METDKVVFLGYFIASDILNQGSKEIIAYILNKNNIYGRMLLTLAVYLTKYSKKFDRVHYRITNQENYVLPNGTMKGIMGMIIRSEVDIGVQPVPMYELSTDTVDFSYPYKLHSATFVTRKTEYKPQTFGIFQTFSLPLWIAIFSVLITMSLIYCVTLKKRYSFDKILLHSFAVLLRQSSILKPSSTIENLLVFSWVVGAMFLCLAYDSVFLSFLAFPPITPIKDVSQLAKAVKEGHYHCIASQQSAFSDLLLISEHEDLRIIGQDLKTNNLSSDNNFVDFLDDRSKHDLALIVSAGVIDRLNVGKKFVSEDRFLETMAAMSVRKDFCCKNLIDQFVHRFMSSGLYFKYQNDAALLLRLPRLLKYEEKDTSKRKLTLTDVAPAFIFLIFGHIISLLVLLVEILSNRLKTNNKKKNENRIEIFST